MNSILNDIKHDFITGYESNCIEFWLPITDQAVPGVVLDRYWISTCGRIWSTAVNRFLYYFDDKDGYYKVTLNGRNVRTINRFVHRIEMLTFAYFPGCEIFEVNHKDGIKHNLDIYNLEWVTATENKRHACSYGLRENTYGDNSNLATINEDQAREMCRLYSQGKSIDEITLLMGCICSRTHVWRIVTGRCRSKIAKEFNLI